MAFFNLSNGNDQLMSVPVLFNTDSMFDLITGELKQGVDGRFYINGGMSASIAGVLAPPNQYKSTFTLSLMARIAAIYQQQVAIFDSEASIGRWEDRIIRTAGNHSGMIVPEQFLKFDASTEYDIAEIDKKLKEFGEMKKAHAKELTITTPFLDTRTMQPQKVLAPTLVILDSLSEMYAKEEEEMLDGKQGLDDSKNKTVYMKDANAKTTFLRKVRRMAIEYGFVIAATAHYGKQLNLDSYGPQPKLIQYMKQGYAPKNVGSKFLFYTSPQIFIDSCRCLQDDAKECWYKITGSKNQVDINEINVQIQRCKNAPAGTTHPYIVSQENGLLTDVTDYNYLKNVKSPWLLGNAINQQTVFTPKVNLTRNTMRDTCQKDPREIRALQLCAQLNYIQKMWNDETLKSVYGLTTKVEPEKLMEFLTSDKNKYTVDRVLESRGYWLPKEIENDKSIPQKEYLSIFEVLQAYSKANGIAPGKY